ncbi:hypothetical protein EK21DRAFT_52303 [Setomelanomma holmii]|uniref:Uncharacterized protein n=1 Tax=Setomelanomma holmii TaxID=210430 RepID=A0A9P4LQN2_9PLEO|nr:hypothetical protein EK21DRAFT_52303 [Setomelanomma holmii]
MPPLPNIDGVRLATPADLERIALVAAAAFFWSPTFRFQRPQYRSFPADTVASYAADYGAAIHDPACAVLVAEDDLDSNETEQVYEALRSAFCSPGQRQRDIVGVCSLSLKPGSCYTGRFQPAGHDRARIWPSGKDRRRDQSVEAMEIYASATNPVKLRYLAGNMRLSTLAVAPAYWRRGHATRLVRFCTQVADFDDALLGISATPHGMIVAAKAGFQECETICIAHLTVHEAREDSPEAADVSLWIGVRLPCNGSPCSSSASGTESDPQQVR